jgi:cystathionine beta-synthase
VVLLPDSGRSYLSKNFDPRWLARWGFGAETAPPTGTVAAIFTAQSDRAEPLLRVHADSTLREALDELARVPSLNRYDRVPVVLSRRSTLTIAAGDVVGSTSVADLIDSFEFSGLSGDLTLAGHHGPPLPTVGLAEPIADALSRFTDGDLSALVLRDGRVVGCISRAELERGHSDAPETESLTAPV